MLNKKRKKSKEETESEEADNQEEKQESPKKSKNAKKKVDKADKADKADNTTSDTKKEEKEEEEEEESGVQKDDLKITLRQKKTEEYLSKLNSILSSKKNKNEVMSLIPKILKNDNITETTIYTVFFALQKFVSKEEFYKYVTEYRYCIWKDMDESVFGEESENEDKKSSVKGKLENLKIMEFLPENEMDIKNRYLNLVSDFSHLVVAYFKFTKLKTKNKYNELINFELSKINDNEIYGFMVNNNIDEENIDLTEEEEDLINQAKNALSSYTYIYEFVKFHPNLELNYKANRILYYNYLIYTLYTYMVIKEDSKKNIKIKFNTERFKCYDNLAKYMELIFDNDLDDGEDAPADTIPKEITKQLSKKIKILYLIIHSSTNSGSVKDITNYIKKVEKKEDKLSKPFVKDFFDKNKKVKDMELNTEKNKFIITKGGKITRFFYDSFDKKFLNTYFSKNISVQDINRVSYENCSFGNFYKQNYFSQIILRNIQNYQKSLIIF